MILILIVVPDHHQSVGYVFTERINNSGYSDDGFYWFLVLPLGFLLTQYTITGFDASAHLSEETQGAADGAAKGIWRSIFYSAVGGYVLLLAFVFAVQDPDKVTAGGGAVDLIFGQALPESWHFIVLLISTAGQLFCTTACLTSASRMTFAFSRDGAIPGSRMLSKVNPTTRIPANAVIFVAVVGALITLPALIQVDINGAPVPVAFYAVVSVAVIGLYLAFLIPIYLRWRMGDAFEPGSWTLGSKYKWMNPIAVVEIAIICDLLHPAVHAGGRAGQRGLRVEVRQLRADPHHRHARDPGDLVARVGQALVHRPEAHHRRGRRQGVRRLRVIRGAGTDRDSAKSPAGSVHQCVRRSPAAASSRSTPLAPELRRDLGAHLLAARRSRTSRSRAPTCTVWSRVDRSRISIHSCVGVPDRDVLERRPGRSRRPSSRLRTASTFLLNAAVTPAASS